MRNQKPEISGFSPVFSKFLSVVPSSRHHNFNRINANMPNSTTQAWARDEQIAWHNKEAKEQVFGAEEHITVK